jgi:hypothetical protein
MLFLDKIYCPEQQQVRAFKALRLNGGTDYEPRLLAASSMKKRTIRIKRLSFSGPGIKLKGASSIQNQLQKVRKKAKGFETKLRLA